MPEEDKEGRPVHPRPTGALPFRDERRIPARLAIAGGCIALAVGFVLGVALVSGKGAAAQLSDPPEGVDLGPVWKAWRVIDEKFVPVAVATSTPVAPSTHHKNQKH